MMKALAAVAAIAAASILGGCITQTGFHWTDDSPKKNETVKGIVDLKGVETADVRRRGLEPEAYFFLLISAEGTDVDVKGFKFDPDKVLGPSVKMTEEPGVAEFANSECAPPVGQEVSYATEDPVAAEPPPNKAFDATFKAEVGGSGAGIVGLVGSGQWYDDGDGNPEEPGSSGDTYECSGFATTVLATKQFEMPTP